jgi:hypothetical protein
VLAGCQSDSAINRDAENSFLNTHDLIQMTDKMAQSIIADPYVQKQTADRPMTIVVKVVVNETNEIIRGNHKELYVARLRALLSGKPELRSHFVFVLSKADYETLRREEGMDDAALGPMEERVKPEYVLTGHFYADTEARSSTRSDMYLCQYELRHISGPETGVILWEDKYETHKSVKKEFLD